MRLDWALIAQSAFAPPNSPPSALGIGSDTFHVPRLSNLPPGFPRLDADALSLPVSFAAVARILLTRAELGRPRVVEFVVQETDGTKLIGAQLQIVAAAPPDVPAGWDVPVNVIAPITISPKHFGYHSVDIFLDSAHAKTIPFRILEVPAPETFQKPHPP